MWAVSPRTCNRSPLVERGSESVPAIIRVDDHISPLLAELVAAAIAWYCTSGIDRGGRLRDAAQALYEQREAR